MYMKLSVELHLSATGHHLSYGITQCYLSPDTSELSGSPHLSERPVFDSFIQEGRKGALTEVVGYIARLFTCLQTVTHPSSNGPGV